MSHGPTSIEPCHKEMDVRLLQYNVGSHSRKGEVVKQQLVQTALQQGLCDLALLQGCSGIHEPVRAESGAVYQPAFVQSGAAQPAQEAGTLLCYTADRFKVRQLSTIQEDLPGCQHSMLLLEDISTGTNLIAIVLHLHRQSSNTLFWPNCGILCVSCQLNAQYWQQGSTQPAQKQTLYAVIL